VAAALGLPFVGRHHSGLDDCKTIIQIVQTLLKLGISPPPGLQRSTFFVLRSPLSVLRGLTWSAPGHVFDNPTKIEKTFDPYEESWNKVRFPFPGVCLFVASANMVSLLHTTVQQRANRRRLAVYGLPVVEQGLRQALLRFLQISQINNKTSNLSMLPLLLLRRTKPALYMYSVYRRMERQRKKREMRVARGWVRR
jgi:hypothetical protein